MAITLSTFVRPGSPVTGTNNTAAQAFFDDYFKLSDIPQTDRKTISILALIYECAAVGGPNYKSNQAQLIQDSEVAMGKISLFNIITAMSAIDWTIGKTADGTLSADVQTLLKEGSDIAQLSDDKLDRIIAFLNSQIQE